MKIRGEILEVKTLGDRLQFTMQGVGIGDAAWRPLNVLTLQVASSPVAERAFFVGRTVTVEIKPV